MPRESLPTHFKDMRTLVVQVTKTTEEELKDHFKKISEVYVSRSEPFYKKLRSAMESLTEDCPYTKHNWRKGLAKRLYEKGHEWNRMHEETEMNAYAWLFYVKKDLLWCIEEFTWTDEWVNTLIREVDRFREMLIDTEQELVWRDEQLWSMAKYNWEQEDVVWITRHELKKSHVFHKPKSYYVDLFASDKDAYRFYKGVIPDNEDTCEFCIEEKRISEERDEKMRLEEEEQEREEEERREERRLLEEEKQRQRQSVELITQHCKDCNYTTNHSAMYQIHITSKQHLINIKKQSLFCKACEHQSRTEIEHAHHLTTTKHKKNTGLVDPEPEEYHCKCCDYKTPLKQNMAIHMKSKKHKINAS